VFLCLASWWSPTPTEDRVAIYSQRVLCEKLNYIHHNPVKRGLVRNAEDWRWSSARDYASDTEGVIPICKQWR
jgi:putative transposase